MSENDIRKTIKESNGSGLVILQKIHLVWVIVVFIITIGVQIGYSLSWKEETARRLEAVETKIETLSEINADLKYIRESVKEIKDKMKEQENNIKDFYKTYRLERK